MDEALDRVGRRKGQGAPRRPPGASLHADQRRPGDPAEEPGLLGTYRKFEMAELTLSANSKVRPGKKHAAPAGAKKPKTFAIYRWSPDEGGNPRLDEYEI